MAVATNPRFAQSVVALAREVLYAPCDSVEVASLF